MYKSAFSKKLKKIRLENDLSKADMARKIGIPYSTYNGYEEGLREPRFETVEKIAKLFDERAFDMLLTTTEFMTEETAEYLITLCGYELTSLDDGNYLIQEIQNNEVKKGSIIDSETLTDFVKDISKYITFSLDRLLDK